MKRNIIFVGLMIVLVGFLALDVKMSFAQQKGTSTLPQATTSPKNKLKLDNSFIKLQEKATKEIDRRVEALIKLKGKIMAMKKVNVAEKSTASTTVQSQINFLNNLKTKIAADTDLATLKADIQSITKSYRIYALIMPQMNVISAADKLSASADLMSSYVSKLQSRISAIGATSTVTTTIGSPAMFAQIKAKIADAKAQASKAISGVNLLVPDNGDKNIMATNTAALKAARDAIKTGTIDLKEAQKLAQRIRVYLNDFSTSTSKLNSKSATSTATTTR